MRKAANWHKFCVKILSSPRSRMRQLESEAETCRSPCRCAGVAHSWSVHHLEGGMWIPDQLRAYLTWISSDYFVPVAGCGFLRGCRPCQPLASTTNLSPRCRAMSLSQQQRPLLHLHGLGKATSCAPAAHPYGLSWLYLLVAQSCRKLKGQLCLVGARSSERLQRVTEGGNNGQLGILIAAGIWLGGRRLLPSLAQTRHNDVTSTCCPSIHLWWHVNLVGAEGYVWWSWHLHVQLDYIQRDVWDYGSNMAACC